MAINSFIVSYLLYELISITDVSLCMYLTVMVAGQ